MRKRLPGFTSALLLLSTICGTSQSQDAPSASSAEPAARSASPTGMEKKKVKMPDGKIREISLPAGAALPPGMELVTDEKDAADAAKETAKKAGEKSAEDANAPVTRDNEPPNPPDPSEFEIEPDSSGMIQFQFRNQRWPELLRWLAEISQMSLDWQELPGDYLNLATQRAYTIEEARDLFNGHLLARGYTMLEHDSVIHVFKTEGINLALVPSVRSSELASLPRNRFVRTSFKLATLIVDEIVEELQPLKSPNGQLS